MTLGKLLNFSEIQFSHLSNEGNSRTHLIGLLWRLNVTLCVRVYIYGILLNINKKGNLAICDNMDGPWRRYANCNKSDRKTSNVWSHLHVESKQQQQQNKNKQTNNELMVTENRLVVARGGAMMKERGVLRMGGGQNGWREGVKRYKLPAIKQICHGYVMYTMGAIVNNTVLYIWKLLRE